MYVASFRQPVTPAPRGGRCAWNAARLPIRQVSTCQRVVVAFGKKNKEHVKGELEEPGANRGLKSTEYELELMGRERMLWERQTVALDSAIQLLKEEREGWLKREKVLLDQITLLQGELRLLRSMTQLDVKDGARQEASSVSSSPPAVNSTVQMPTAVATTASSRDAAHGPSAGSDWEALFSSNRPSTPPPEASRALNSVAAAIAAVDAVDVLSDIQFQSFMASASSAGGTPAAPPSQPPTPSLTPPAPPRAASPPLPTEQPVPQAASVSDESPSPRKGPPPELSLGADDIWWVSKLHSGLSQRGFHAGDEDIENWMFLEGTQSAVLAFQACERLPETGTVDAATWERLGVAATAAVASTPPKQSTAPPLPPVRATPTAPSTLTPSSTAPEGGAGVGQTLSSWPVLMEGDGGRAVHAMQAAMARQGYHSGDDDMRWWQFGPDTLAALRTFQACAGISESGVCDVRTWLALLGTSAKPSDILALHTDLDEYNEDMETPPHPDAIWLLGEQRWEVPVQRSG